MLCQGFFAVCPHCFLFKDNFTVDSFVVVVSYPLPFLTPLQCALKITTVLARESYSLSVVPMAKAVIPWAGPLPGKKTNKQTYSIPLVSPSYYVLDFFAHWKYSVDFYPTSLWSQVTSTFG